jgi:hypothetical protein
VSGAWGLLTYQLPLMEHASSLSPNNAEVLYDLACLRLSAGKVDGALAAGDVRSPGAPDLTAYDYDRKR